MEARRRGFGLWFARRRTEKGLSQAQVAKAAHTSHSTVGAMERGERLPDIATLEHIAAALGLSPEQLAVLLRDIRYQLGVDAKNARILANNPALATCLSGLDDTITYGHEALAILLAALLAIARLPGGGGEGQGASS